MTPRTWMAVLAVGGVGHFGALMFGFEFKKALLIGLLVAWAAGAYWVSRSERKLVETFKVGSVDYQQRVLGFLGSDASPFLHKVRGTFRTDWRWAGVNVLSMVMLIFGLPLAYSIGTERPLSWDLPLTPWHFALAVVGFALWVLLRRLRARAYRCPGCRAPLSPIVNHKLSFECSRCDLLWHVLDQRKWV